MKTSLLLTVLPILFSFALIAQSDFEKYKHEQNQNIKTYKEDYNKELKGLNDDYNNYLQDEKKRLNAYRNLGYISEKTKARIEAIEKLYPRHNDPIGYEESVSSLELSAKKWKTKKVQKSNDPELIKQELVINQELINIGKSDENLVKDIVESVPTVLPTTGIEKSEELKLEIEANRPIMCPLPKNSYRVSSHFSEARMHPILHVPKKHEGIDLAAPRGTKIFASAGGVVIISTYSKSAGKYVVINHENGYTTSYMHMNSRKVKVGQRVKQGQLLGTVGSTGYSTGNHIHYEIRLNGDAYNPAPFIVNHFQ